MRRGNVAKTLKIKAQKAKAAKLENSDKIDIADRRARNLAIIFLKMLVKAMKENDAPKNRKAKSPFTSIIQKHKSIIPLVYLGHLYSTLKAGKQPAIEDLKEKQGINLKIGRYLYIMYGMGSVRVGFDVSKDYKDPYAASPIKRQKNIKLLDLLTVLEQGKKIPITDGMRRFYGFVKKKFGLKDKTWNEDSGGKGYWEIPARPFWKRLVQRFINTYKSDQKIVITQHKKFPYSINIKVVS